MTFRRTTKPKSTSMRRKKKKKESFTFTPNRAHDRDSESVKLCSYRTYLAACPDREFAEFSTLVVSSRKLETVTGLRALPGQLARVNTEALSILNVGRASTQTSTEGWYWAILQEFCVSLKANGVSYNPTVINYMTQHQTGQDQHAGDTHLCSGSRRWSRDSISIMSECETTLMPALTHWRVFRLSAVLTSWAAEQMLAAPPNIHKGKAGATWPAWLTLKSPSCGGYIP